MLVNLPEHIFLVYNVKDFVHVFFMNRDGYVMNAAFKEINAVCFHLQFLVPVGGTEFDKGVCININIINDEKVLRQRMGDAGIGTFVVMGPFQFFLLLHLMPDLAVDIADTDNDVTVIRGFRADDLQPVIFRTAVYHQTVIQRVDRIVLKGILDYIFFHDGKHFFLVFRID